MVTTAMGSPVVTEALAVVPDLDAGADRERDSCWFQLLHPTGAGCPDVHTPVRPAPAPMDLELARN
ncbi:hypothetical protein GCM10009641_66290 [Mycobacterium cookii]|uniref:Uncharacterized protein n=1 Tax=Nocardioides furvisabuli TaxID=375542 RepID=A0ABN2WN14_9ACTN